MNYFLNYVGGRISVNPYRKPEATVTDVDDIVSAYEEEREENLVADLSGWIKDSGGTLEDDHLERLIEGVFGLQMYDYPELRDIQRENETN